MLKKLLKILGILIVICMLLIAVGFIRSNGEIVISTLDIASEKISDERTICVLGDLHSKHFSSLTRIKQILLRQYRNWLVFAMFTMLWGIMN